MFCSGLGSVQLDDMGVAEELEIFNLSFDSSSHVAADELLAGDDLEGDLLAGAVVNSKLDFAKGAFAEGAKDLVGADALLRLDLFLHRCLHVAKL